MSSRIVCLHIGDTHCGLRSGLMSPNMQLRYDNGEEAKESQSEWTRWVWNSGYMPLIQKTAEYADGDPVVVIHTGDVVHGVIQGNNTKQEYMTTVFPDQQEAIAVDALSYLRDIPTLAGFIFAYGTAAHDFGQQQSTKEVASQIAAWGYDVDCRSWARQNINGCIVDIAHRGPNAGSAVDRSAASRRYAIRETKHDLERGVSHPSAILRGHIHTRITERVNVRFGNKDHEVLMSVCPPLCGPNEYGLQYISARAMPYVETGGTLFSIEDGAVVDYRAFSVEKDCRYTVVNKPYGITGATSKGEQSHEIREKGGILKWLKR